MNIRPVFACAAMCLIGLGCSDPPMDVAQPAAETGVEGGGQGETAAESGDGGRDAETSAPTDSGVDPETADEADTDSAPLGVGLPCTNMEQCATYGLACTSMACATGTDCPRRYTCQPHPPDSARIECVTTSDCAASETFCVGLAEVDDTCRFQGFTRTKCIVGPAVDPKQTCGYFGAGPDTSFGATSDALYTCVHDADCILNDAGVARCCPTGVGVSYCASSCDVK